jgi:hypothetical protein
LSQAVVVEAGQTVQVVVEALGGLFLVSCLSYPVLFLPS